MANLEYLVSNSGDSVFEEYSYYDGILRVVLYLTEIDKRIKLLVKTDSLKFDNFYLEKKEELYRICRIDIQELRNVLSIENNIYVPPAQFAKLMDETRQNYNLAYGRKSSEIRYIFSLVGYGNLISCLISGLDSIVIDD